MAWSRAAAAAAIIFFAVGIARAQANPFVFVNAKTEVVFDQSGRIAAVRNIWQFDEAFTKYAIQGLDTKGDGKITDAELKLLADVNVKSLAEFKFLTYLSVGRDEAKFLPPKEYWLEFHGDRLTLFFTLPLENPMVAGKHTMLEIFDPKYFVAFTFLKDNPVKLINAPKGCASAYHPPRELDASTKAKLAAIPGSQLGHDLPPDLRQAASVLVNHITISCPTVNLEANYSDAEVCHGALNDWNASADGANSYVMVEDCRLPSKAAEAKAQAATAVSDVAQKDEELKIAENTEKAAAHSTEMAADQTKPTPPGTVSPAEGGVNAYRKGDYATALQSLTPLAEQGNLDAEGILGFMYDGGYGVAQNYPEAIKWYRKFLEQQPNAKKQSNLGSTYELEGFPLSEWIQLRLTALDQKTDRRVALVIGNSEYQNVPTLNNPTNDASLITDALKTDGFGVTVADNLSHEAFITALKAFATEADNADWAVVYFAGHGIEIGGTNYLIPVDAKLRTDRDVSFEAIPIDLVIRAIEGAHSIRIVILDACRNNPFKTMKRTTSDDRAIEVVGLAPIEPTQGSVIVYSARPGKVAADGDGADSPFAMALAQHLTDPGVEVLKLFRLVRDDVLAATSNGQEVFQDSSLPGTDFFFRSK